jgi:hypothetical protein
MNQFNGYAVLVALATIEGLTEIATSIYKDGVLDRKLLFQVLAGVAVALVIPGFDFFAAAGVSVWPPIMGRILSGVLGARGAKLFHDFLGTVEGIKNLAKNRGTSNPTATVQKAGNAA